MDIVLGKIRTVNGILDQHITALNIHAVIVDMQKLKYMKEAKG